MPAVSVIIPVYNSATFIEKTILSALSQTYTDIEVIAVDDGSTDGSCEIIKRFTDSRLKLIKQKNAGVSAARNTGIQNSKGEFIALLDHDDLWYPEKLEKQIPLLEKSSDVGLVYSNASYIDAEGNQIDWQPPQFEPHRGNVVVELFVNDFIPCLTAVFKKKILEKTGLFNEKYRIAEEYDLFLKISRYCSIDYVDEVLACYRIHQANLSRNIIDGYLETIEILEDFYRTSAEFRRRYDNIARRRIAGICFTAGRRYQVEEHNRTKAIEMFKKSLSFDRFYYKSVAGLLTAVAGIRIPRRSRMFPFLRSKNIFDQERK